MNGSVVQRETITGSISTTSGELNGSVSMFSGEMQADIDRVQLTEAEKLKTERKISLTGEAVGEAMFDGSHDAEISTILSRITNAELEDMLV